MSFSIFRSARVVSILTLVSRVLGLARDMAFSAAFGVGSVQSAFQLAFQIPNLFRRLFGEGALSAASIPVLSEKLHRDGREAMDGVAGRLIGLLIVVLTALCLIAEVVIGVGYWLYGADDFWSLTLALAAVMAPYMILVCLVAILGGIQNVFGRFALPAAMPIVMNVLLIATVTVAGRALPGRERAIVFALAVTVLVVGSVQLVWQWRAVRRAGLGLKLSLDRTDPAIVQIKATMLPMIAGLGAVQLNTFADGLIASWFVIEADGQRPGMAILYFAQRLYQFPQGVFMVALATAIFPALSRHAAEKDWEGLARTLERGIRAALFIIVPCMVGLILVREPLVRSLFNYGRFKDIADADERVAWALAMYALALWAYGLSQLVVRAFYATKDAKTPLKVAVVSVVLNIVLNLILVQTALRESGLALATAIGATLQVSVLLVLFSRRLYRIDWSRMVPGLVKIGVAACAMGLLVVGMDRWVAAGLLDPLRLTVLVATGAGGYALAALLLRCEEMRQLMRR